MLRRSLIAALVFAPVLAPAVAVGAEEKKKGGGLDFIQIQTLTATVKRRGGGTGVLTVETGLDVPDHALHTRAEQSVPRLRAAFAGVLMNYSSGLGGGAPPDAEYLSREMQRQADLVLGKPGAKLLLGTILIN